MLINNGLKHFSKKALCLAEMMQALFIIAIIVEIIYVSYSSIYNQHVTLGTNLEEHATLTENLKIFNTVIKNSSTIKLLNNNEIMFEGLKNNYLLKITNNGKTILFYKNGNFLRKSDFKYIYISHFQVINNKAVKFNIYIKQLVFPYYMVCRL